VFSTSKSSCTKQVTNIRRQIPPGPPKYSGKYDAPTGAAPVVTETGDYPPDLEVRYKALAQTLQLAGEKLSDFVNSAWPGYKPDQPAFKQYTGMVAKAGKEDKALISSLMGQLEDFAKASGSA
jgi:hypothetical protein